MAYYSTKTYGHELGLSVAFRQHKATSHCQWVHGYSLSFKFTFSASELDANGWVVDFGGLKELKEHLCTLYDHKLLIAEDDPSYPMFIGRVADVRIVPATGCEAFAKEAHGIAAEIVRVKFPHAKVESCEVSEHGGNSAIYMPEKT